MTRGNAKPISDLGFRSGIAKHADGAYLSERQLAALRIRLAIRDGCGCLAFSTEDVSDGRDSDAETPGDFVPTNTSLLKQDDFADVVFGQFGAVQRSMFNKRDRRQVGRVAAALISAQVVQLLAVRDRTDEPFVHPPVKQQRPSILSDLAVASGRLPSQCVPAACLRINLVPRRCLQIVPKDEPRPFPANPTNSSGRVRSPAGFLSAPTLTQTDLNSIRHGTDCIRRLHGCQL